MGEDGINMQDNIDIVRCKECKWFTFDKKMGLHICTNIGGMNLPEENDFCSCGERREQDGT